jgi:hypothetical protein
MYVYMDACRYLCMHMYMYAYMYACGDAGNYAPLSAYVDGLDFPNAYCERKDRYYEGPLALAVQVSFTSFPCISLR